MYKKQWLQLVNQNKGNHEYYFLDIHNLIHILNFKFSTKNLYQY